MRKTLPASLKDYTTRMNDRNKYKVTGQINYQTADLKVKASAKSKEVQSTHKANALQHFFFFPNHQNKQQ